MENTLQSAGAGNGGRSEANGVELTAAGRLLVAAAIAAAGFGGWRAYQYYENSVPVESVRPAVAHSVPAAATLSAPVAPSPNASAEANLGRLNQVLQQERAERSAQAVAWRAVADTNRQQLAVLSAQLGAVESKIDTLEKSPPAVRAPREVIADVASSARAVHPALDAAKVTAQVDVASLPVETVSAQSLNLTALGNGVIQIGSQKLSVGQPLTPGETIVAVDPVSHSIVTNRRILNVTN